MLEKPDLPDEAIIAMLRDAYGLQNAQVTFLPLGADVNTAVYRVTAASGPPYFLKLRSGPFEEMSVLIPWFLHEQAVRQIIAPHMTKDGRPWIRLAPYTCVLYPYVEGRDAWDVALTETQWVEFGSALKRIHSVALPPQLHRRVPVEMYTPHWREVVTHLLEMVKQSPFKEPVAAKMAEFMRLHRGEIKHLVTRAAELAAELQAQPPQLVLCHTDVHAGNLLLPVDGGLYIVDWDNPLLTPKERDLMFIGGGVGEIWNTPKEEALFYQGYGAEEINLTALAYYRYERVVQDIAAFGEAILLTDKGGEDREQSYRYFASSFLPNSVIEIAQRTDQQLQEQRTKREK